MSYLGLTKPLISRKIVGSDRKSLAVLEIGIETGFSSFSIIQNLIQTCPSFAYVGIDVKLKPEVCETIGGFSGINYYEQGRGPEPYLLRDKEQPCDKTVFMYQENSLTWLERNKGKFKFDIIIIDGDHNYFTVSKELELIKSFCLEHTIILCDDYYGKYSERDLYYADRAEYADVSLATRIKESERTKRQGVKNAIDDFVNSKDCPYVLQEFKGSSYCMLYPKGYNFGVFETTGISRDDVIVMQKMSSDFKGNPFI